MVQKNVLKRHVRDIMWIIKRRLVDEVSCHKGEVPFLKGQGQTAII